ncbi:MAG: hypothetical protein RQ745_06230 [Longimicrobiales bacterium]|nr:hypothetical protein [Longimicrobiales bacterium]
MSAAWTWRRTSTSGYTAAAVELVPQLTYVLRVPGGEREVHFGAIRVTLLSFDQNGDGIMIFDWAFQLQPGNPSLSPRTTAVRGG